MLKYAREDTHYLLYIYDVMRKELIEAGMTNNATNPQSLLRKVIHESSRICMKSYEKPITKSFSYSMVLAQNNVQTPNRRRVLKMILKWRDYVARVDDESTSYMLPKHIMF